MYPGIHWRRRACNSSALIRGNPVSKETIMSEIGKHKLSDAVPHPKIEADEHTSGKPVPTHATAAEQVREEAESKEAHNAEASIREHMVNIGRGNQQAGRQGQ
jgi:hypothetical protein